MMGERDKELAVSLFSSNMLIYDVPEKGIEMLGGSLHCSEIGDIVKVEKRTRVESFDVIDASEL